MGRNGCGRPWKPRLIVKCIANTAPELPLAIEVPAGSRWDTNRSPAQLRGE